MNAPSRTVLHVVDNYHPALGGLERAVAALSRRWVSLGVRPVVLTGAREPLPGRETVDGVTVIRVPSSLDRVPGARRDPARVFFPPVVDPWAARHAARVVAEFAPDIVHGHGWMMDAVAPAFAGVPTVLGWHDFSAVCARKSLVRDAVSACPGPSMLTCVSCAAGQYGAVRAPALVAVLALQARRRPARSTRQVAISSVVAQQVPGGATVVPSFVDDELLERANSASRPEFVPDEGPYLVYAGQMTAHKGVPQLLEAHRALVDSGVRVPLVMLGLPMPDFDLAAHISAEQAPLVVFRRQVEHSQVLGAFRHASAGVAPSLQEALGQVAVEMLASGCPAVVSSGTGLAEVVEHGVSGLHVAPGDVAELAGALRRLLDDDELRQSLSAAGPDRAERFTLSSVLPGLLEVYTQALGEPFLPNVS